ncbi:hypothetical protein ACE1TF_18920 [Geomicrobium sp. JSM 1781026]|uniref:hypothetical protein n=1 Tax=Geomicrobium sp. JSM 1781026 TaxID=3344580 RepID=UPI0035C0BDD6
MIGLLINEKEEIELRDLLYYEWQLLERRIQSEDVSGLSLRAVEEKRDVIRALYKRMERKEMIRTYMN